MSANGNEPSATTRPNARLQRGLLILVVGLGILIVAGLGAVVTQLVRLALRSSDAGGPVIEQTLPLPAGAAVKALAVGGQRVAVHYATPDGESVAILDADTGRLLARVRITASPPSR